MALGDVLWSIVSTVILALSPSLCGFIASQFVSAYAIPSRSMEATLRVGDVVLAEKISSLLKLPPSARTSCYSRRPTSLRR